MWRSLYSHDYNDFIAYEINRTVRFFRIFCAIRLILQQFLYGQARQLMGLLLATQTIAGSLREKNINITQKHFYLGLILENLVEDLNRWTIARRLAQ